MDSDRRFLGCDVAYGRWVTESDCAWRMVKVVMYAIRGDVATDSDIEKLTCVRIWISSVAARFLFHTHPLGSEPEGRCFRILVWYPRTRVI